MIDVLIFRTDSGPRIGAGHLLRCLALAQAWMDGGGHSLFLVGCSLPEHIECLRNDRIEVVPVSDPPGSEADARTSAAFMRRFPNACLILDGYHFGPPFRAHFDFGSQGRVFIDDLGTDARLPATLVLNHNPFARPEMYPNCPSGSLLLGSRYFLLRREFRVERSRPRTPGTPPRILITLGGGAAGDVATLVLRALHLVRPGTFEAAFVQKASQAQIDPELLDAHFPVRSFPFGPQVHSFMTWADIAVCAGGVTSLELAYMGVPSCIFALADHQAPMAEYLEGAGAGINLGNPRTQTPSTLASVLESVLRDSEGRDRMGRRASELVDGQGAFRTASAIRSFVGQG